MSINLIPTESLQESPFWKKFFYWSVTVGRVVIIGTQLVVLGAFFTRFFLDRRIIDLSEEIKTKQTILQTTTDLERSFRQTQDKLVAIRKIKENQNYYSQPLKELSQKIPPQIKIKTLNIRKNKIGLAAAAPSGSEFAQLMIQLTSWEGTSRIFLESANFSEAGGLDINLTLVITEGVYKKL